MEIGSLESCFLEPLAPVHDGFVFFQPLLHSHSLSRSLSLSLSLSLSHRPLDVLWVHFYPVELPVEVEVEVEAEAELLHHQTVLMALVYRGGGSNSCCSGSTGNSGRLHRFRWRR